MVKYNIIATFFCNAGLCRVIRARRENAGVQITVIVPSNEADSNRDALAVAHSADAEVWAVLDLLWLGFEIMYWNNKQKH